MHLTLRNIAKIIDAQLIGDNSKKINGIGTLEDSSSDQISFAISEKYKKPLMNSDAGAVIVNKTLKKHCKNNILVV